MTANETAALQTELELSHNSSFPGGFEAVQELHGPI